MLPGSYERWFVEICGRGSPVERRSTCDSCAMLPPAEPAFDPAVRCCTYHPFLAPHFVGGILASGSESGRALVRARIAAQSATPLGLGPSRAYAAARESVKDPRDAFGHARELLCPFYADARCTIWQHRGVPCAAFHCKLDRGALGFGLWNLIVVAFNVVERALAVWLLRRQGLHAPACDKLLHAPDDEELYARAWGSWRFREEEYFLEAARLVEPLTWAEVVALGGADLARLGTALREAVERFDRMPLPERVRRGEGVLYKLGRVHNPSVPFDPLEIPEGVARRIEQLDSAPLEALKLEPELARRLLDWQALVGAQ